MTKIIDAEGHSGLSNTSKTSLIKLFKKLRYSISFEESNFDKRLLDGDDVLLIVSA